MILFNVINGFTYSIGWLICVFGLVYGYLWIPAILISIFVVGQLLTIRVLNRALFLQDFILLVYAGFFGLLLEIVFLGTHLFSYQASDLFVSFLPPISILFLYFLFSMTLNHAFSFLKGKIFWAFIVGAIGGGASYFAGFQMGAISFSSSWSLYLIALFWGILLSFLVFVNTRLREIVGRVFDKEHIATPLTVFFDGRCKVCSKECEILQKRKQIGSVIYLSIKSEEELKKETDKFSFQEAMSQIHAIDANGTVLKGIPVFSELYSRVDLQWIAVLLKAPLLHQMFKGAYFIWTKCRHFRL